jgi:hypothetical protein
MSFARKSGGKKTPSKNLSPKESDERFTLRHYRLKVFQHDTTVARGDMRTVSESALPAATEMKIPATADYVFLSCGRAYERMRNPPTLRVLSPVAMDYDDENDDQ